MKKFYITKKAFFAVVLMALAVVACGLKITSIDVKSDVVTGEEFTMTLNLEKASGEYQNNNGLILYFGARVPESWSATKLVGIDTKTGKTEEENTFSFVESEGYAKVLDFCFPCKTGYKWIAFQSISEYDVNCESGVKAMLTLKAGDAVGTHDIDIVAGGSHYVTTDKLLTSNGEVNINEVFGRDIDGKAAGFGGVADATVFKPSEYIILFGTISKDEIDARTNYLGQHYSITQIDKNGDSHTLPLAMEITNVYDKGAVKINVTQSTGIEDIEANAAVAVKGGVDCIYVAADGGVATVYNEAGRMIDSQKVDGEATLRAEKGVCIVEVVKDGKKIVKKVAVK